YSAFAGNPMLLSLESLVERGWLLRREIERVPRFAPARVEFERVIPWKNGLLRRAYERFRANRVEAEHPDFASFRQQNCAWLDDYARFMALKDAHQGAPWWEWNSETQPSEAEIEYHQFLQFEFFRQWGALKDYCAAHQISLMGDLPIYISRDSADVWAHPDLFRTDLVAGVPPDYFSATGQLWGNPTYHWERIAAQGYHWWVERMRAALRSFDAVRMDHFRGFEAYWGVPASETTAMNGEWIKGPAQTCLRHSKRNSASCPSSLKTSA
ncbi:MAG: 4-alpha-glucanotransferase, partial [Acidobacteriia bacterium]|nr:4-alpha-glucanotransferase [Terriglobia bacterium]